VTVLYDGRSERTHWLVNLLTVLDIFHRLTFKASGETWNRTPAESENHKCKLVIATPSGPCVEADARRMLAKAIPLLWPLVPYFYVREVVQNWK
jgi:hypothetical protein